MNVGGYPVPGSGNGEPPRLNRVDPSYRLWRECRDEIEQDYPFLVDAQFFDRIEALMLVLDIEEDARHLGGDTWLIETPDEVLPVVSIYFTYKGGLIVLRAAHASE